MKENLVWGVGRSMEVQEEAVMNEIRKERSENS